MSTDALVAALMEIERHVAHGGWDQPARLFALVPTADLMAAEPSLVGQLDRPDGVPQDALSSIEQDGFRTGDDLIDALEHIAWPETVHGCALAVERLFVPTHVEPDIPEDPDAAADFVARHPERRDVRVVVGVTRGGERYGLARLKTEPDELLASEDLVPGLGAALTRTLTS
ncbi:MAG: PPA1309 family protein [Propioniciclava sp.]|uniref:PPA1309 family protein n=1 Tax=Propioniciclava sp. TaxID=2038686 RepID=UPI0039E3C022